MNARILVATFSVLLSASVFSAEPIQRILVIADESRSLVHYVDQTNTNNNFSVKANRPVWDLKRVAKNKYRYVHGNSFTVIDLKERKDVETFSDNQLGGLSTVCDLPDGGFLAGTSQKAGEPAKDAVVVYRYAADRKLVSRSVYEGLCNIRMMTVLKSGEVLLSHNDGVVRCTLAPEGSEKGTIVQAYKLPRGRNAYKAIPRKGGGFWVAGGYAGALFAYSDDGQLLKTFQAQQPEGLKNCFYAGLVEQANGHVMIANWTGHGAEDSKTGWQVIEFDAEGNVVWHLHDPMAYGSISDIDIIR